MKIETNPSYILEHQDLDNYEPETQKTKSPNIFYSKSLSQTHKCRLLQKAQIYVFQNGCGRCFIGKIQGFQVLSVSGMDNAISMEMWITDSLLADPVTQLSNSIYVCISIGASNNLMIEKGFLDKSKIIPAVGGVLYSQVIFMQLCIWIMI